MYFELNEHTRLILGQPNFQCAHIARILRMTGREIKEKAEEEQAAAIYWMLEMYWQHGENWATAAEKDLRDRVETLRAKTDIRTDGQAVAEKEE